MPSPDHSPTSGPPVVLVCVPYAPLERPSMGLSVLKAALAERQIGCEIVYANLSFAQQVGVHAYDILSRTNSNDLAADWTFRRTAFPDAPMDEAAFFAHIGDGLESFAHLLPRMGLGGTMRALAARIEQAAAPHLTAIAGRIVARRPRIVGCGSTFQQHMAALALLRLVKEADPDIVTMMGGANCEAEMGVATHRECPWIDYVVSGEAEEAFPALCQQLLASDGALPSEHLPSGVIGPCHSPTGEPSGRPPRAVLSDMNEAPVPDFSDYFGWLDATIAARIEPGLMMETSRGCWWGAVSHCTFCGLNGESMGYRYKSAERVLSEVRILADRYSVPRIYTVDNILPQKYFDSVIPGLAETKNSTNIFYETKANLKRSHLESLAAANIRWIQPGIESFDDDILKAMKKGTTGRQNILALRSAREFGVNFYWLLLYDFPGESDASYERMAEWLPSIAHLQPPRALSFVQYVRFSPYERQRENYGLQLESERAYHLLYPWKSESIEDFAYYFDDYTRQRDHIEFHHERPPRRPGLRALRTAFLNWTTQWPHFGLDGRESMVMLYMEDSDAGLTITDTRACATAPSRVLTGLHRSLCLVCYDAPPESDLAARLEAEQAIIADQKALQQALDDLLDWRLVLRLGRFVIGLSVAGRPRSMPPWTDYPGGRVIPEVECTVRDKLDALGRFAGLAAPGLAAATQAAPDPASLIALIANCWLDSAFQTSLTESGAAMLRTSGMSVRPDATVRILVDSPERIHFVLAETPMNPSLTIDSLPAAPSFLDIYAYLYESARRDAGLRRALVAQPRTTLRQLGIALADELEVVICEASADEGCLSIPTAAQLV